MSGLYSTLYAQVGLGGSDASTSNLTRLALKPLKAELVSHDILALASGSGDTGAASGPLNATC